MVEKCKHCGLDLKELKPTQKGNHISHCKMNPNVEFTKEKMTKGRLNSRRIKNPILKIKLNCLYCSKEFEIDVVESYYKRGRYKKCCCIECSRKYSSSTVNRDIIKIKKCKKCGNSIKVNVLCSDNVCCNECKNKQNINEHRRKKRRIFIDNKYICKYCGEEKCERPEVCRKFTHENVFEKYLGFDSNKKGTKDFYVEFDRVVNKLKEDYFDNELSLTEIANKYKMNYQTVHIVFKSLGIIVRSISESLSLAIKNGKIDYENVNVYPYKSGYHINWKGKQIHYRSNYEKEYYSILDEKKIDYEVESLKISYYDTQKNKTRIAIPDIFIRELNEIIEIKSKWTLDQINMNDRIRAYKKLGYNVKLLIGEGNKNFFKNTEEIVY